MDGLNGVIGEHLIEARVSAWEPERRRGAPRLRVIHAEDARHIQARSSEPLYVNGTDEPRAHYGHAYVCHRAPPSCPAPGPTLAGPGSR